MAEFRQTSFASGELAPTMWGRTDLQQYEHGLRLCRNFVIDQHGAAVFRPGFRYVTECAAGANVRLFGLNVSETEAYLLVFTAGRVRIHPNGGATYTEVETTYTEVDVRNLRFQQLGRGVLVFCPGKPIREIRGSGTTWANTEFKVEPQLSPPPKLYPVWGNNNLEKPTDPIRSVPNRAIFGFSVVYRHIATDTYHETSFSTGIVNGYDLGLGNYSPVRKEDGDLEFPQGNPWANLPVGSGVSDIEKQPTRTVFIKKYPDMPVPDGYEFYSFRLYKGVLGSIPSVFRLGDGVWGLIAEATGNPKDQDVIITFNYSTEPNYADPPRTTHGGFVVYRENGLWDYRYPTVGAVHDQRLVLAAPNEEPDKIWFSQVNSFDNFDLYPLPAAHHALTAELGSKTLERIRALVSHNKLVVLTDTALWVLDGAGESPISVGNISARVQSETGAAPIDPIVLGPDILYVGADRGRVFRARYDGRSRMYDLEDLSIISSHIFQSDLPNSGVVAWAVERSVANTVWIRKRDDFFASLTYAPETGVLGFSQHTTDGNDGPLDFATLRVSGKDVVFAVTMREWGSTSIEKRYIERLDGSYNLDSYVTADTLSELPSDRKVLFEGLSHLLGRKVYVVAHMGNSPRVALGPFTVTGDGAVEVEIPTLPEEGSVPPDYRFAIGLPYVGELELLDFPVEKLRVKSIAKVGWEVVGSRGLLTGEDFDHLTEWLQTTIADVYGPAPATGIAEVYIGSSWNKHGRAVLRQPLPLPLTVLGVTREGSLGG